MLPPRLLLAAAWLLAPALVHGTPAGISFQHKDWELACDNTLTCRAAGYSGEQGGLSVLLTRPGGPQGTPSVEMVIADYDEQTPATPRGGKITLQIDGQARGIVQERTPFSPPQTEALLHAIKGKGKVAFQWLGHEVALSGAGAYAVLLKMDEFQGRLGTVTALTQRGERPASRVPPAQAAPLIRAAPVPSGPQRPLTRAEAGAMAAWLATQDQDALCAWSEDEPSGTLYHLSREHVLAELPCWQGAYNASSAYILLGHDLALNRAHLVTTEANHYEQGQLSSAMKGRGLGDCWVSSLWIWNGHAFIQAEESSSGSCRLITPGGPWHLPTLTSRVVKAP